MPSEFDIIARYFAPIAGKGGLGLLDDAALLKVPDGHELVVTTDAIVVGVHFFADDAADTIAKKALGVNLSDLAAKGADPIGFVLNLMLPKDVNEAWIALFAQSLGEYSKFFACPLVGGDTVLTPGPLTLSITVFGSVPVGQMVRRNGAKPGDVLFVTGTIGDAALGLKARVEGAFQVPFALSSDHLAFLNDRYQVPRPRNGIASILRTYATAAMDISDGFVGDLTKMLALAGVSADVVLADVPHSVAVRAVIRHDPTLRDIALTGGDDYEVLATVPVENAEVFAHACLSAGVKVTKICSVQAMGKAIRFLESDGSEKHFPHGSYVHGVNG
jgi:thiamine-monophosphate kinase